MDPHQQRRQDGQKQAEEVHRDQAFRLEPDPRRAGQRGQDRDNR